MTIDWKHTAVVLLDIVIGIYLLLAITAFNEPVEKATVCSEVNIHIGDVGEGFLNPAEVKHLLQRGHVYPLAQPLQFISTRRIEESLRANPYVKQAECYKSQNGHVNIKLTQCRPAIRVLSSTGQQYYVDADGEVLPLSHRGLNVLVATGHITKAYASRYLTPIGTFIQEDRFWSNQVVQLNVLPDGTLELIPRVGDHVVYLGAPRDIPRKLERLRKFYKYGFCHAGWNRYSRISLEFDNQIICKKKNDKG